MKNSVIILAGGKSSRMGYKNKSFIRLGDKSFIEIMIEKVSSSDDVIIVTNTPEEYEGLGVKVVTDFMPHIGPLGGIYTGLSYAKHDAAIVVPCDTPFLSKEYIEYVDSIANDFDGIVPYVNGYYQPLCGAYAKSCIELFKSSLEAGITKIIDLYPQMNIHYVTKEEIEEYGSYDQMFRNINTPKDYNKHIGSQD